MLFKKKRWSIRIEKLKTSSLKEKNSQLKKSEKEQSQSLVVASKLSKASDLKFMNNYISVGCDALVTLNFHRKRENLYFANRLLNKVNFSLDS
jgi:hypothetical protein